MSENGGGEEKVKVGEGMDMGWSVQEKITHHTVRNHELMC